MKRIIYSALLVSSLLFAASCGKDWLTELANNPNQPSQAPVQLVLPPVLSNYAGQVVSGYARVGNWMGYFAYSGSYSLNANTLTYFLDNTEGDWNFWFGQLKNVNYIEETAAAQENMEYFVAAAKTLKAFGYQYLADSYNMAPYTEAFKGSENFFPTYDLAKDIYSTSIADLDSAIAVFTSADLEATAVSLGSNDIMFDGDVSKWAKFANTLKLRMLLRQSNVINASEAKAEIQKTVAVGYLTADANVNPGYLNTTGKLSPLWAAFGLDPSGNPVNDFRYAGGALMNFFKDFSDPRLFFVYAPNGLDPDDDEFNEVNEDPSAYDAAYLGNHNKASELVNSGFGEAPVGHGLLKSYSQDVYLISAAESYFMQAEAIQRGWLTGDAKDLFQKGITASFNYLGVKLDNGEVDADSAAEAYYTSGKALADWDATPANRKIEAIITQKWASDAISNNYEAWAEYRRTGFPIGSILPLSKYPTNSRHIPNKYMFPKSESNRNSDAYNAAVAKGNDPQTSKIFWMK